MQRRGSTDAPAVVFVGGTGGWSGLWDRYMRRTVDLGFQAIAIDLPPFGYALPAPTGDYSKARQGRRLLAAIDSLKLEHVVIVAHSIGAAPVMEAAFQAPRLYHQPLSLQGTSKAISEWLPEVLSRRGLAASDNLAAYATLPFPVELIWGETDTITPLSQGRHLRQLLADSSLVVIPRAGHGPFLEEPDLFEEVLAGAAARILQAPELAVPRDIRVVDEMAPAAAFMLFP